MNNSQETTNLCDVKYKIVFLGEMTVGKSSIIQKFTKGDIDDKYQSTIGIDFLAKNVIFKDSMYRLQLWDTAGQERFKSLIPAYMRDANCAVIVYDVNNKESFNKCKYWYEFYKQYKNPESIVLIVGNKIDEQEYRQVSYEQGLDFAKSLNEVSFCQLSAKTGKGLQEMFEKVIQNIFISKKHSQQEKVHIIGCKKESILIKELKSQSRINKKTKIEFKQKKQREFTCCYT